MPSRATSWVASLSPWPEEFGLDTMRALLAELGEPQRSFRAVHVVGTNGKSTTTRMVAALLEAEGLSAGAYTSPHVAAWSERIWVDGGEADFEGAVARVRPAAERVGATQFETLTAAAFAEFAERGVEAAAVEAGLGGRLDATNVVDAPVVVLTNVALEHTDVLGDTREAIAGEKLAVVRPGAGVVLGHGEWEPLARDLGASIVTVVSGSSIALAHAAAETLLGRRVDPAPAEGVRLAGRLERRREAPLEIWDGAHTLDAVGWLLGRLPTREYVVVASVLRDKDAERLLAALSPLGDTLIATASSNERALPPREVVAAAGGRFERVEAVEDPGAAVRRARELAGQRRAVLVTGSLYLLADLHAREDVA